MSPRIPLIALGLLVGCDSGSEPLDPEAPQASEEPDPSLAEADDNGAETEPPAEPEADDGSGGPPGIMVPYAPPADPETIANRPDSATVWVGLYCETEPAEREFSFWANGRELERMETVCGPFDENSSPHGQFSFVVPIEVLLLRVQDDTADSHSEIELGITSDRFVTITHRQVGADSGFLTSFEETNRRPRFAVTE